MLKRLCRVGVCGVVLTALCWAQVRPPRGRSSGANGRGTPQTDPNAPKGVYPTAHGVLKSISGGQLLMEVDDEHEMKFRITRKTKFFSQSKDGAKEIKAAALEAGQTVDVDMQTALDGAFEAVHITVASVKQGATQ